MNVLYRLFFREFYKDHLVIIVLTPHIKRIDGQCYVTQLLRSIGKNPSPTLPRNSAKIEYISGGQSSPYELAFGVKLDPNSHSKIYFNKFVLFLIIFFFGIRDYHAFPCLSFSV